MSQMLSENHRSFVIEWQDDFNRIDPLALSDLNKIQEVSYFV
jgi:hypothetical protein